MCRGRGIEEAGRGSVYVSGRGYRGSAGWCVCVGEGVESMKKGRAIVPHPSFKIPVREHMNYDDGFGQAELVRAHRQNDRTSSCSLISRDSTFFWQKKQSINE